MTTAERFSQLLAVAERRIHAYLADAENRNCRAISLEDSDELASFLELERWTQNGGMREVEFEEFLKRYLSKTTCLHHPRTIGHQVAKPMMAAVMADLVNGVTNNGMAVREMGPPAVAIELHIVKWMCTHLGFPAESGGVLTHGGSLANLTALLAARAQIAPRAWEEGIPDDLVVLAPESTHYSIARAAGILGLGTRAVWGLACHADGSIDSSRLGEMNDRLSREGRRVLAVCANACSTATGAFDDLRAVGAWCRDHRHWLHVDGAHGASALLSAKHRHLLDGIERADSVTWDAHKMLHTSGLCAAVLVREEANLLAAFAQKASYLGNPDHIGGVDPYQRAVECTKSPLGLKLFLNLAIEGESGLAARLDHLFARTVEFADFLRGQAGVEVPFEPQSNILCFRIGPRDLSQALLRQKLIDSGEFYITAAQFGGCDWLRLTVMNPLTTLDDIKALHERLLALAS